MAALKKGDLAWVGAALAIVAVSRLAIPGAPALYEGIQLPTEPFHYCTPPANLASSNKQPGSGAGELTLSGGLSQLGSINTSDNQLLTFFPKGALQAEGATRYKLTLKPECQPAAPPTGNKIVGDAYNIDILGEPGDTPVKFLQPAQVLMRTPPVAYTSVQQYYDGNWHDTQWGQQQDIANITINHVGVVALLDDGRKNPPGKPPSQRPAGIVTIVEVILVSAALGIVIAAIIVQQRRGRELKKNPRKP